MPDSKPIVGAQNRPRIPTLGILAPSLTARPPLEPVERAARHSREAAIGFDRSGNCVWMNQAALQVLGLDDAAPLVGRLNLRRHSLVAANGAQPEIERAFQGETLELPAFGYDLSSVASGNGESSKIVGPTHLIPSFEENGRVTGVYAFHRPWAEKDGFGPASGSEDQDALLVCSIDTAKRMVRRVTHDFKNLIAVVRGYASVLQGRPQLDQDSKELVGLIEQAGSQLAGLTDRMGQFADTPSLEPTRLNLNRIVEDLLEQNRGSVPENIEVLVDLGYPMPDLLGDKTSLNAVCWNLWQNGIASMPRGGTLLCQTSNLWARDAARSHPNDVVDLSYVRLRVSGTGDGMDTDTRAGMLGPFFTTRSGKGRGLGTTVVYETVKAHGGYIEVSSAPGSGTCIDVYLPAAAEAAGQPSPSNGTEDQTSSPLLLIVDDDDMVRMAIQRMLAHLGFQALVAASGEEALGIYQQLGADIAVVILDLTMPGMDGIETLDRLREIDSQVKIIVSSGDALNPAIHQAEAKGISYMIHKPFRIEQLARVVQQTIG